MAKRNLTWKDNDILQELQKEWHNSVKIDYDILNEPCIFFARNGHYEMVYKLSIDGTYMRERWFYVKQAHDAIISLCESMWIAEKHKKQDYKKENEQFMKQREKFEREGFRENLPEEGET